MKKYTIYNQLNGNIVRTGYCSEEDFMLQTKEGESIVGDIYKDDEYYYANGVFERMLPKPDGIYYFFDHQLKQWVLNREIALAINKAKRNNLLVSSDYTQLADVDIPNKTSWQAYRQALRDMTDDELINGSFPQVPLA